jgi:hypothetical protein
MAYQQGTNVVYIGNKPKKKKKKRKKKPIIFIFLIWKYTNFKCIVHFVTWLELK